MLSPEEIGPFLSRTTPRLILVVFAIMIALFVSTGFLTRSYNREKRERAEHQYLTGQALVAKGNYDEATEMYTEALTLARSRPKYRQYLQALALALVESERTDEAEIYLLELLREDPANGLANLMLARIYRQRGDGQQALQYYQRAIYGLWEEDPAENRIKVRFELIEDLEQERNLREMEAELLRLLDEIPHEPVVRKRVAKLFMVAQSYDVAQSIFTEVTEQDPGDAEAFAGLGDAEFELGHYLSARTAYRHALRLRPDDVQSQSQADLASEIISLDPMLRGLGSQVQLDRSRGLVRRSLKGMSDCLSADTELLPEPFLETLDNARKVESGAVRQRRTTENVEDNIALAEKLEDYRMAHCAASPVPDRALELVLRKLAQ